MYERNKTNKFIKNFDDKIIHTIERHAFNFYFIFTYLCNFNDLEGVRG